MKLAEDAAIIVMTAFSKPQLIATGKKLKVDHWLAKPFDVDKLAEAIELNLAKRMRVA